ncbi:hypothetical protein [Rothia endophytica]|uniref:Asparagine synthase n=1 Tax=Rothia endophytica TaxID=1324766 RepID=A0ABP9AZK3_9MICC
MKIPNDNPHKLNQILQPASETEKYLNFFSRGFLILDSLSTPPVEVSSWNTMTLGDRIIYFSPDLPARKSFTESGEEVVVLGIAFGISSKSEDSFATANRIATTYRDRGLEASLDYLENVSGRFVALIYKEQTLNIIGDPMGTISVFWYKTSSNQIVISSHDALISDTVGGLSSNAIRKVLGHPDYISPQGRAVPGILTPHDNVQQLFPNCMLTVKEGVVEHSRIFPRNDCPSLSLDDAYELMVTELTRQINLWLSLPKLPILGLTAGQDSGLVLAAGLKRFQEENTTALTYHFFDKNTPSTLLDLKKANKRALLARLPHAILDINQLDDGNSEAAKLYNKTFRNFARFPSQAMSFYESLPFNSQFFLSVGGEIGNAFYQDRSGNPLSPISLSKKYTHSKFQDNPELLENFAAYIDYVEFDKAEGKGYDLYDLFYWEHRLGKWASLWYSELDLTTMPAIPMNSRKFLNAMLSQPFESRKFKKLYSLASQRIASPFWQN